MSHWLSSLSRLARVGLLVSITWAILVVSGSLAGAGSDGEFANWGAVVLFIGLLPIALGWGIRFVRGARR